MKFPSFTIITLLSLSTLSSASRNSPRTAISANTPQISPSTFSTPTSATSSSFTKASTVTIPTPVRSTKEDDDEAEAFLTAAKATVTPAPAVIIDADGSIVSGQLQEKWHLTTFTSCHTFDATFAYCGVHEPVLPGGDEIAGAVRVWDARGGVLRAVMVVLGTLIGVDVFLR